MRIGSLNKDLNEMRETASYIFGERTFQIKQVVRIS